VPAIDQSLLAAKFQTQSQRVRAVRNDRMDGVAVPSAARILPTKPNESGRYDRFSDTPLSIIACSIRRYLGAEAVGRRIEAADKSMGPGEVERIPAILRSGTPIICIAAD